jgi:hypothetical protein
MDVKSVRNQVEEDGDLALSPRPIANVGKRFYTWATLGTFAGASFLVSSLWVIAKRLSIPFSSSEAWPLLFSVVVMVAFAFATEPGQPTRIHQKIQKGLVTVGNTLLVYFTVVGGSAVATGIIGA